MITEITNRFAARAPRIGFLSRLAQARALRRQRRQLLQMDDHLLRDIGLTPQEAATEGRRKLWDVPSTWRY